MRKLFLFMMVTLDGFFEGENHDLSWHNTDEEFNQFAIEQTSSADTLLFGRKTYELMEGYWPTENAKKDDPLVAELMINTPKIVFSRTLNKVNVVDNWKSVKLIKDNISQEIMNLKNQQGKDIAIYGSNNLTVSLTQMGLVDEFRIMVNPVVIGRGTLLFAGLNQKLPLKLIRTQTFKSGNVLLCYTALK